MLLVKRVLYIRVSGKERKEKVRKLLYDLAHFRNILIILLRRYEELYGDGILNQSILYGLLSSKPYSGKYKREFKNVLENILRNKELKKLAHDLRKQKEKVGNPYFVQSVIRQVIKDFRSFFEASKEFKKNPSKFKGKPNPPKPKKLKYLMNFSAEGNANTFERKGDFVVIRLREGEYLKVKLPEGFPHKVSSVRLKFFGNDLYVEVVYERKIKEIKPKGKYRAGIDIGLDELLAVVSENPELRSFIVSGKEIKSFNQWFNKERAKLQSQIDYLRNELKSNGYDEEGIENLREKLRELEIKQKQPDWIEIVLLDGKKGWIQSKSVREL